MDLKINIKARLQRHARNASFLKKRKTLFNVVKKFKFISLIIVLILPIYPSFWAIGIDKEYAVWSYDESTILSSYQWDTETNNSTIFSQESWFVRPSSITETVRDTSWINDIIYYIIQDGDNLWLIASRFHVSIDSIIWSNNFTSNTVINPWDTIKIPPVTWIVYIVEPKDDLDSIASKYKLDKLAILTQNQLDASAELKIWQQIVLPWAKKAEIIPPVVVVKKPAKSWTKLLTKSAKSWTKTVALKSWYTVKYTGKWSKFAYGNCTYYVANHKNVTWKWNANQWLSNARAAWVPTWSEAANGAIISFRWSWYNPYYWHVWIVSEVGDNYIIVKDMNYRRFNEVTVRKIPKNDPSIKWYIYAN